MADDYDPGNDAWRDQVRENSARHAFVYKTFTSHGSGELVFEDPVEFGLWFSEVPMVSYGYVLDPDVEQTLADGDFPMSAGAVLAWRLDARGLYIGATCFAVITGSSLAFTSNDYDLIHHFTFSGIGVKNLGASDFEVD